MATLRLPAPVNLNYVRPAPAQSTALADPNQLVPPYGLRSNYIPRKPEDYGDGGAFPEIHVKQYPLDMGRKKRSGGNALQLRVDAKGKTNYDVVVREGQRKNKTVFTKASEMEEMEVDEESLARPTGEELGDILKKTQEALDKKLKGEISTVEKTRQSTKAKPVFFRYTPADKSSSHNSGSKARIIKLHEMQVDPLEPPKFRAPKLPARPSSPPVPVMRSPQRNVTQEDQKNWKIPPCVSNWKNNRGYAVPLHLRLSASGQGLQDPVINDRFARLAEALYFAERSAREEVEARANERRKRTEQLREQREKKLRGFAEEARNKGASGMHRDIETPGRIHTETPMYRGTPNSSMGTPVVGSTPGMGTPSMGTPSMNTPSMNTPSAAGTPSFRTTEMSTPGMGGDIGTPGFGAPATPGFRDIGTPGIGGGDTPGFASKEEIEKRNARHKIREEARKRQERKYKMERNRSGRSKRERDVSEKIALGHNVSSGDSGMDARLYNRDSGIAHGFGAEDSYNVYDKPMSSSINSHIYRPTRTSDVPDEDAEMQKILNSGPSFTAHKGFKGTEETGSRGDGPVQFEKIKAKKEEDDIFGVGDIPVDVPKEDRRSRKKEKSRKRRRDDRSDSDEPSRKRKKKSKKRRKERY